MLEDCAIFCSKRIINHNEIGSIRHNERVIYQMWQVEKEFDKMNG